MKLFVICLALAPAAVFSSSSSELSALFGPAHDAGSVMAGLSGMMGQAQQKLSLAERHHKKVVKKVRDEAAAVLEAEATEYGKYLSGYAAELAQGSDELAEVVSLAKAAIAKSEAKPTSPNDWKDPEVEMRAKLGAQVSAAERSVKKSERHVQRSVREAEEKAEETIEDEAQKLGMKVGDMTPLVDKAKQTLEAAAEKKVAPVAAKVAGAAAAKDMDLKTLSDKTKSAQAKSLAGTAEANKKLDGFLTKTGKDLAAKTTKIQADLESQQKAEIEKVIGHVAPVVPKTTAHTKKAVAAKAVPAKKIEKPVPVKAAPVKAASVKAAPVKAAPVKAAAAKVAVAKK